MARNRTNHGTDVEAQIAKMAGLGWTAEHIAKILKSKGVKGVSRATIGRRLRELRGKVRVGRAASSPKSKAKPAATKTRARAAAAEVAEPTSPQPPVTFIDPPDLDIDLSDISDDEIPEGLSLDLLHRLRTKADRAASAALGAKDLATFAAMGRLVTSLSEAIRKATPPEKPDPNDNPDMVAAAKRARELLHRRVDQAVGHE